MVIVAYKCYELSAEEGDKCGIRGKGRQKCVNLLCALSATLFDIVFSLGSNILML